MPAIKSAKKKLKVDRKRESANKKAEALVNLILKKAQRKPTPENIQEAFKTIDKVVKNNIFHKNKGARIKSRLSKFIKKSKPTTEPKSSKSSKTKEAKNKKKQAQ